MSVRAVDSLNPSDNNVGNALGIGNGVYVAPGAQTQLNFQALAPAGGDQPHNNMQPYLTFYFCIALQGVFPPRG